MVRKHKHKVNKKGLLLIVATLLILGGVILFVLEKTHTTYFFSSEPTPSEGQAQTTSDIPSAQPDYNGGALAEENKEDPGNTVAENQGSAIITDNAGAAASNKSEPKTSSTGEITVYLPLKNSTAKTGQEISGTSSLSVVQYRLIDSVSGVIATGSLNVINGNFSGILSFSTSASEGRLDIFAARTDASEYSSVEIPVRFR